MADSLFDILSNKDFSEPPEIAALKAYVKDHFHVDIGVSIRENEIFMTVPSASLAGTLRFHMKKLREVSGSDKRIVLRIGS